MSFAIQWSSRNERITRYTNAIKAVFQSVPDKRLAHQRIQPILRDLAADPSFLTAVFDEALRRPGALNKRHYPTITINVELNAHYGLDLNCWIPLANRASDVTTKAIHHHGNMLLTTVTVFGLGYEHWTFQRPVLIDAERELFHLELLERARHGQHHVAFVDSYIAHVPVFPPDTSITAAVWSNQFSTTWRDHCKRLFKGNERLLRRWLGVLGLTKALDLKIVQYFDFFPTDEGFKGMKERTEFKLGPNEDYLASLFHVFQATGNQGLVPLIDKLLANGRVENSSLVRTLRQKLESGEPIEPRLSAGHDNVPFANFTTSEIERALAMQGVLSAKHAGSSVEPVISENA